MKPNAPSLVAAEAAPRSLVLPRTVAILVGALATALAAQVVIPLPNTPVPMTLQTLMVLLTGTLLGPSLGAASMGLYLLIGIVGLPVFSMGRAGIEMLATGATGGYLVGFLLAQPLLGRLSQPGTRYGLRLGVAFLSAQLVIFTSGVVWLAVIGNLPLQTALGLGLYPFLLDAVAKCVLAFGVARAAGPTCRRLLRA